MGCNTRAQVPLAKASAATSLFPTATITDHRAAIHTQQRAHQAAHMRILLLAPRHAMLMPRHLTTTSLMISTATTVRQSPLVEKQLSSRLSWQVVPWRLPSACIPTLRTMLVAFTTTPQVGRLADMQSRLLAGALRME